MRFLTDMGIGRHVTGWLRERGHDATHLRDEGLKRLPDEDIFSKAITEDRVILTLDLDFSEIVALSGEHQISVIIFRLKNTRATHIIERLGAVLATSSAALADGCIITVEETRHRIRKLPI